MRPTGPLNQPPKVPRPEPAPRVPVPSAVRDDLLDRGPRGPVLTPDGDRVIVTFAIDAPDATAVLLFANRLTDESDLTASLMERVGPRGPWALSLRMPPQWRASYSFLVHDGDGPAPWQDADGHPRLRAVLDRGLPDPGVREPGPADRVLNRAGTSMSVVSLPDAPAQPWLGVPGARRPERHRVAGRDVWVHLVGAPGPGAPVVVVLDGEVWLDHHGLPAALGAAHADGAVPSHVAAFVASGSTADRWDDVGRPEGVTSFVAASLVPWLRSRWAVSTRPEETVIAGQSLGGLSALWAVARHGDVVGAAIAQSASLWRGDPAPDLAAGRGRVHLSVGRQEWTLLPLHRALAARVRLIEFEEFEGGHDYACWRGGLVDAVGQVLRG